MSGHVFVITDWPRGRAAPPIIIALLLSGITWAGNRGDDMVAIINAERAKHGAQALVVHDILRPVCRTHNLYQRRRGSITHQGPRGRWPQARATAGGWTGKASENVVWSSIRADSAASLHSAFMSSPGHRRNLLNPRWRYVAVRFDWSRRGTFVTCMFGSQ